MQQHCCIFKMYMYQWIFRKWTKMHRYKNIQRLLSCWIYYTTIIFSISLNTIDIHECSLETSPCHSNATSINIRGYFQCTRNNELSANGTSCKGTKYFDNMNSIMISRGLCSNIAIEIILYTECFSTNKKVNVIHIL